MEEIVNEVARKNFQTFSLQATNNGTVPRGASLDKLQTSEMGFTPIVAERASSMENKTSSFLHEIHNPNHFYSSPKRGLMSASTSAFTKPRVDTRRNGASRTENEYIGVEQRQQQYHQPPLHPKAEDAMLPTLTYAMPACCTLGWYAAIRA